MKRKCIQRWWSIPSLSTKFKRSSIPPMSTKWTIISHHGSIKLPHHMKVDIQVLYFFPFLLTIALPVLPITSSDYPLGIFKFFYSHMKIIHRAWSFLCSMSSVKMRSDCSFCWYWWNWLTIDDFLFIMWGNRAIIILLFHMQITRLEKLTHFISYDIWILVVNNVKIKQRESPNLDKQYKISERYTH